MPTSAARTIVCATDLSDAGGEALRQAAEAAKAGKAKLVVVHVLPEPVAAHPIQPLARKARPAQLPQALAAAIDRVNAQVEEVLGKRSGVDVRVEHGVAHAVILERAEALRAGLIVVGAKREHVGHEAERVVRYAHCPVLVARPSPGTGPVLAATDLSDSALPAVRAAADHARRQRCPLVLLHVVDLNAFLMAPDIASGVPVPLTPDMRKSILAAAEQRFHKALRANRLTGEAIVEAGAPVSVILEEVRRLQARLLVVGTAGATGLKRMVLGSVAESVVRQAPCATLVVRLYAGQAGRRKARGTP
jgi:nucleotide-binding universal stress UspA family protein